MEDDFTGSVKFKKELWFSSGVKRRTGKHMRTKKREEEKENTKQIDLRKNRPLVNHGFCEFYIAVSLGKLFF